jgi:dienelactone hydrolase
LESLPSSLERIPLEYIENSIMWMKREQTVLSDKICIYGRSKGGELALLAASMFKEIKGVIAYTPSNIVWQGLDKNKRPSKYSSWSYEGKEIPFLKFNSLSAIKYIIKKKLGKEAQISDIYKESLNKLDGDKNTIDVEKINGPILLFSGEKDEFWESKTFCENIMKRLENRNSNNGREHYCYEDSGHFITMPYQGLREGQKNPEAIVRANEDSWSRTLDFLKNNML